MTCSDDKRCAISRVTRPFPCCLKSNAFMQASSAALVNASCMQSSLPQVPKSIFGTPYLSKLKTRPYRFLSRMTNVAHRQRYIRCLSTTIAVPRTPRRWTSHVGTFLWFRSSVRCFSSVLIVCLTSLPLPFISFAGVRAWSTLSSMHLPWFKTGRSHSYPHYRSKVGMVTKFSLNDPLKVGMVTNFSL